VSRRRVELGMLAVVLIWGVNIPLVKAAFATLPPLAFNVLRYSLAALLLTVADRVARPRVARATGLPSLAALGLVGHTGYQYLFITGLSHTTAGNSSLILATVPLLVAVVGVALGVERPTARVWLGLLVAFAGLAVLVHAGGGASFRWRTVFGDVLILGSALCWAVYTVLGRPWLDHGMSPLRLTVVTLRLGLPLIVLAGVPDLIRVDWRSVSGMAWVALVFSATFAIVVAYVVWYASVSVVGGARTAAISNLVPVVTLIAAWAWLGETLTVSQLAGAAIVLLGVWFSQSSGGGP
jgi:drug/metabolite transporter (DMT)-like permease